jgi:translation initiation factor 2B subunit (eIF-2B alpha/beta/delta family)
MNDLIPSPEVQKFKEDCALLHDQLASLLTEREQLVDTVIPNILAKYATTVGVKEYEALAIDVEVRKLKATIQKIQAMENHGKKPNLEQIEAAVEDELREWQDKVDKMVDEIQQSQERLKHQMTSEESEELQKLYRILVKKLHPDLNPEQPDKLKVLWQKVQQAYGMGNLQELKALALMVEDVPDDIQSDSQLESLEKRRDQLKKQADDLLQQISDIKNNPPLTLLDQLADPDWVSTQIAECETRISRLEQEKKDLTAWISRWKSSA